MHNLVRVSVYFDIICLKCVYFLHKTNDGVSSVRLVGALIKGHAPSRKSLKKWRTVKFCLRNCPYVLCKHNDIVGMRLLEVYRTCSVEKILKN